jgi:hypothetical protein
MEDSRQYFEQRAAQCRRLAQGVGDPHTVEQLTELALEFDAKARNADAPERRQRANAQENPEAGG